MKPYLFINPKAGMLKGSKTVTEVREQLAGLQDEPDITIGKTSAAMQKFIARVKKDKPAHVYVAGGDGTISTIIRGLMDTDVMFGLIPTGSMNNIAQSLGIGDSINDAVDVINSGQTKPVDLGKVNGEVFIESVGIGLVAEVMDRVGEQDSKKEVLKVIHHTISEIMTTDTIPVKMKTDGTHRELETVWLTVTNTGRAAAAVVDPTSDIHDKRLEVVYCEPIGPSEIGKYIVAFVRNSHIEEEKFHRIRAKHVDLMLPNDTQVHVDGELRTWSDVTIDILPGAIKVFAP